MTTEHYYEREHQIDAWLAGLDAAVEDARKVLAHDLTWEAQEAFDAAVEHARSEREALRGVDVGQMLPHEAVAYLEREGLSQSDARDMAHG